MSAGRRIALTGASGGIGAALARQYADDRTTLFLCGRDVVRLASVAESCRTRGAAVHTAAFDLRDELARESWVRTITADGRLDVLVAGAGVSASVRQTAGRVWPEDGRDLMRELTVNAVSNICCVNRTVELMLARKSPEHHLQIGLIASLAGMTGLPSSPGYSASKAALRVYGESLRRLVLKEHIGVTVLLPGFIQSPMSRRYQGRKPFLMSAERAAELMVRALESNKAEYAFPWLLAAGIRALGFLPAPLQRFFLKSFVFNVLPDGESASEGRSPQ